MEWTCSSSAGCARARAGLEAEGCLARQYRNPRFCQLGDPGHSDYQAAYERLLVEGPDCSGMVRAAEEPAAPERPSVAAVRAKHARMRNCPHWQRSTDCGCGNNRCALGRGDRGVVSHDDCYACPDLPPPPEDA